LKELKELTEQMLKIPYDIESFMSKKYAQSELMALGHLLELQKQVFRHFTKQGLADTLEINRLLKEIQTKWRAYHDYEWLDEVETTVLPDEELDICIPDGYEHVMQELVDCMLEARISEIPEKYSKH
jgi:hypothetical protein